MVRASWLVLVGLLLLLVAAAATFDPRSWPSPVGDEATYLMAAQSLAWDGDYRYSAADFERFRTLDGRTPDGLILHSDDGGKTLVYGKSFLYPAAIAPFVRLLGRSGPAVANALLLAAASLLAAWSLRAVLGATAPLFIAVSVFGSVTFAHVFWAHSDLALMSLCAAGLALTLGDLRRPGEPRRDAAVGSSPALWAWAVAGVLFALVVVARPVYAPLLLAPLVRAVSIGSWRRLAALALGLAAVSLGALAVERGVRGTWSSYAGERVGFYSYTGFPSVDPGVDWSQRVATQGGNAWVGSGFGLLAQGFEARQATWNVVYTLLGRHVGLLPYFLPLILGLIAARADPVRVALLLAVVAVAAVFLLVRPFNFFGGGGSLANRYMLPVFPAFWFLAARPIRLPVLALVVVFSGLFVAPLWGAPRGYLLDQDGGYRYVSAIAERWLPYETTQSHLKPSGGEDFHAGVEPSLWIKPLAVGVREAPGVGLRVDSGASRRPAILVGADHRLARLRFERVGSGPAIETIGVELHRPRASHRMWWTDDREFLYTVDLGEAVGRWLADTPGELVMGLEATAAGP